MAKRRKKAKPNEEYDFLHLEVLEYSASTDAAINYEVVNPKDRTDETRVFRFSSSAFITCRLIWPDERPKWLYSLTIYAHEPLYWGPDMTLKDCQVRDDRGSLVYRKRRGMSIPEYKIPHGIGALEKVRGKDAMTGAAWVSPASLTDMLLLLANVKPLWVEIHELKIGRIRWIRGLTLKTARPE